MDSPAPLTLPDPTPGVSALHGQTPPPRLLPCARLCLASLLDAVCHDPCWGQGAFQTKWSTGFVEPLVSLGHRIPPRPLWERDCSFPSRY